MIPASHHASDEILRPPFPGLADDSEQSDDVLSPDAQCSSDQNFEEPSSSSSLAPNNSFSQS